MRIKREDGIHYNRKFNRWELWIGGEAIYLRYINDPKEDIMDARKATIKMAKEQYGFVETDPTLKKVKLDRKEFKGNILVTISEHEVRLWVCDQWAQNIFRFKALGEVKTGGNDIVVIAK
jgi:hypothetical protein